MALQHNRLVVPTILRAGEQQSQRPFPLPSIDVEVVESAVREAANVEVKWPLQVVSSYAYGTVACVLALLADLLCELLRVAPVSILFRVREAVGRHLLLQLGVLADVKV